MLAAIHPDHALRRAAIARYGLGSRVHAGAFDGLVELASQITDCPIALVSIVREADQVFEASCGLDAAGSGLDASVCAHAILQDEMLEIGDLRADPRTADNPLVTDPDDPLLFYAGAQIRTPDGVPLGALCVLDRRPRRLGDAERRALRILADQVMQRLELHDAIRRQDMLRREVDHRVKNNLANVAVLARMASRSARSAETRETLAAVERRIQVMVELHSALHAEAEPGVDETELDVPVYLGRVVDHLRGMAPRGVAIEAEFAPLRQVARQASALGVLVNEVTSNACRHGFPDGRAGRIVLRGAPEGASDYVLTCEDDGIGGVASEGPADPAGGLGLRIVEASASQLSGRLSQGPGERGWRTRVAFPVALA